jgi:hypothetical protein
MNGFSKHPIENNFGGARREDVIDPREPKFPKTLCLKNFKDGSMLNLIKSLFKIKFKDDHFFLGMMTQVKVFKGPGKAILKGSTFDEPILVPVNNRNDQFLQFVS